MPAPTLQSHPTATAHTTVSRRANVAAAIAILLGSGGIALPAFAGPADVCYAASTPNGQVDKLTAATVLDCPVAGHRSLTQLAQAGWTVASIQPVTVSYTVNPATHSPESANAWMVVVQTPKDAK